MGVLVVKLILIYSLFDAVLFCFCWSSSLQSGRGGNETDRLALLAIKAQIKQDPYDHNAMSSWNESIHFCMWDGVTCSRRHRQRITKLDLQSQNLTGSLSPHIGNLSFLRELLLQNNSFSHGIPPEIGNLHRLQVLLLNNNSFTGPIPYNISYCFNLTVMNFGYNMLVGKIPSEIGSLLKLQVLVLQKNNLRGEIPPSLGNLSSLEVLATYRNNLVGSIPSSLGQLKQLTFLALGINNLSGTIPPSIYNLSALDTFAVELNQIEGSIFSELGNTLPNLQVFSIGANKFTGHIPLSISNATNLAIFSVGHNYLTGPVPNLQKLHNLFDFVLNVNQLGSAKNGDLRFLSELTNATELTSLVFDYNNFGGTLPTSISNLSTNLARLWADGNQLHGTIPAWIWNLVNLEMLYMGNNAFTGNIPNTIGKLPRLRSLNFADSELSGSIPSSVGNLTELFQLYLDANYLHGSIPLSLGKCHALQQLGLSSNNLNGTIPENIIGLRSISVLLDLSNNQFTGSLPVEVGNLKSLGILDLSNNMLSGELPGSLARCESLEVLHLEGNFFKGPIPSSMSSLRGIQVLDLSRNNLSGEIPQFLEGFGLLDNLNLSFNNFWGAVPIGGVFKNASAVSIVGNTRLCGGVATLQLPKCNFTETSKKGGSSLSLKLIIPLVSGVIILGIAVVLSYFIPCFSRKKKTDDSLSNLGNSVLQVSYATLLKATDGFSLANLIGAGGFGSVYRGVLDDSGGKAQLVAIKVFNLLRQGASKSFISECEALRNIRHRNLVKIITACSSVDFHGHDFKALVYEFMPNGSLEEWLHPTIGTEGVRDRPRKNLNLLQRLDTAIGVASALDYLHNHCGTPIVHCDLKPSNVLMDNELIGHVSDFGLARFLPQRANNILSSNHQSSSIGVRGTVGYLPPEYGMGSEVSAYGDVYSFGILLLEMFTGKRPTDAMFSGDLNLRNFVEMGLPERVTEVADSLLQGGRDEVSTSTFLLQVGRDNPSTSNTPNQYSSRAQTIEHCLSLIFRIGIDCSIDSPKDRKGISYVVSELHSIRAILLG